MFKLSDTEPLPLASGGGELLTLERVGAGESGEPEAVTVRSAMTWLRTKAIPTLAAERLKPSVGVPLYATVQSISVALDAVQSWGVMDAGGGTTVERGFCQVTNVGAAVSGSSPHGCGCPATPL